jgi:hypothetical protein
MYHDLQQCHSIDVIILPTITHLSQVVLSGWRHIHDDEAEQPQKKKPRIEPTTSIVPDDIVAKLQQLIKLHHIVSDICKVGRFQDGILKYILTAEDAKNILTNIIVLASQKDVSYAIDYLVRSVLFRGSTVPCRHHQQFLFV